MSNSLRSNRLLTLSVVAVATLSQQCTTEEPDLTDTTNANETEDESTTPNGDTYGVVDSDTRPLDGSVPEVRLCDDSQSLRLVLTRLPPHVGGAGGRLSSFPFEVGLNSIWVRGDCRFWVQQSHANSTTPTLRTGVLSEDQAAQLAADVLYSQLGQFDDHYGNHLDLGGYFVVSDGEKAVWCRGYCTETPTAPKELVDIEGRYRTWNDKLRGMSEDVTGPMWALLVRGANPASPPEGDCDPSWPFTFDPSLIAQIATPETTEFVAHRLDDPEATELRQWWRHNIETPNPCVPNASRGTFLIEEADGTWFLYHLAMRDSIPLENPDGLIPLPAPESE